jgi:hypothetical protein
MNARVLAAHPFSVCLLVPTIIHRSCFADILSLAEATELLVRHGAKVTSESLSSSDLRHRLMCQTCEAFVLCLAEASVPGRSLGLVLWA